MVISILSVSLAASFALGDAIAAPKKPIVASKKTAQIVADKKIDPTKSEAAKAETAPVAPAVTAPQPNVDNSKIKAQNDADLLAAKTSKDAGDLDGASKLWIKVYDNVALDADGAKQAAEAAKNLGFAAFDKQDLRRAEAYFAAETILLRKVYFTGAIGSKPLTDGIKHWASAAGLMTRSNDSSALIFYAKEIAARERAALSSQILNRQAEFSADKVEGIKINIGTFCATSYVPNLARLVTCDDERNTKTEAYSLQARQIKADAPKPMSKEERAAKDKKDGKDEE